MPTLPTKNWQPSLPCSFPKGVSNPKFKIGDRVRFVPMSAEDHGTIVGLQYAPAEHLQDWAWRYSIWLDPQSLSRAWVGSDLAWEDDLELLISTPVDLLSEDQSA